MNETTKNTLNKCCHKHNKHSKYKQRYSNINT